MATRRFLNRFVTRSVDPPPSHVLGRALIIHAHPRPGPDESFSGALKHRVEGALKGKGHEVRTIELGTSFRAAMSSTEHATYFEENVLFGRCGVGAEDVASIDIDGDLRPYLDSLLWCDRIVWIFPTWWMGPPAPLKGFVDRLLRPGVAFRLDPDSPGRPFCGGAGPTGIVPLLTNVRLMAGVTTYGASWPVVQYAGDGGKNLISRTLAPLCGVHGNCAVLWRGLHGMDSRTDTELRQHLDDVEAAVVRCI
jgi:putative NADPH-quinone reductase